MFLSYLIVSILLPVGFGSKICGDDVPDVHLNQCCSFEDGSKNVSKEECFKELNPSVNIVDKKNGIVELNFDLKHIKCVRNIKLFVEDIDKNECDQKKSEPYFEDPDEMLHTQLEHSTFIQNHDCPQCEKIAKIYFSYIFSGCYHIEINEDFIIMNHFIDTDYKKVTIDVGSFNKNYNRDTKELVIYFIHELFKMNYLNLKLFYKLPNNTQENSVTFVIYDSDLKTTNENERLEVCKINESNSEVDFEISNPVCDYQADTKNVKCIYQDIPEGKYEFVYRIQNEPVRCNRYSVWNDDRQHRKHQCKWNFVANLSENSTKTLPPVDDDEVGFGKPILIILIIIFVIFGALVISTGFYLKRGRIQWSAISGSADVLDELPKKKKVFLLYARDCQEFMDLMSSFRILLSEKFDVYDMYDRKEAPELSADSDKWICDKLINCKTILVLSKCADIQNRQTDTTVSLYKKPSSENFYFLYALKNLRKDNDNYEKLHVVNFEYDTEDYESFVYINTYARYNLPRQLSNLIATLRNRNYEKLKSEDNFLKKYKLFENYRKDHPNYLEQIINTQV